MTDLHQFVAYVVVALFAIGWIWGLGAWALKRSPGERYWLWVTVVQVSVGVQAIVGVLLFVTGKRAPQLLHYAYGIFPVLLLVGAHVYARKPEFADRPWFPFAVVAFFCFGLTLRALMTGLGVP